MNNREQNITVSYDFKHEESYRLVSGWQLFKAELLKVGIEAPFYTRTDIRKVKFEGPESVNWVLKKIATLNKALERDRMAELVQERENTHLWAVAERKAEEIVQLGNGRAENISEQANALARKTLAELIALFPILQRIHNN